MKRAGYYIFLVFNYVLTLLPMKVLYLLSDLSYYLMYYIIKYRRPVVEKNLENAFPEKSRDELTEISKQFYRHLCDLFVETLKATHMSPSEMARRLDTGALADYDRFIREGRDIVTLCSHYNNWEWVGACMPLYSKYKNVSVYKPVQNQQFNRFINKQVGEKKVT